MQVIAKLRAPKQVVSKLHDLASRKKTSVSDILRQAMTPYLEGTKTLHPRLVNDKATTFVCYEDDLKRFKDLAKDANLPWDEAIRLLAQEYIHEHKQNSKTSR